MMNNYSNINLTSKTAVERSLTQLKQAGVLAQGRFLPAANGFNPVDISVINAQNESDALSYLPVSVLTHLHDGWCYLGMALHSMLLNNVGLCGHAAYYAELRAAMSFLAVNGILTLNHRGYYVDAQGGFHELYEKEGTHQAVWNSLSHLATLAQVSSDVVTIDDIIRPEGIPLHDWINSLTNVVGGSMSQSFHLLTSLGLDIQHYHADRDGRNKFSYSPTDIECYTNYGRKEVREIVTWFWKLFEPAAPGRSVGIDYCFLLLVLQSLRRSLALPCKIYRQHLEHVIQVLLPGKNKDLVLPRVYGKRLSYAARIVQGSAAGGVRDNSSLHVDILIRAGFLLEVATKATRDLLSQAGVVGADLKWWVENIQLNRLMWQAPAAGCGHLDLWDDIDFSLQSIETYAPEGTKSWIQTEAEAIENLSTAEYIMLWGLGL